MDQYGRGGEEGITDRGAQLIGYSARFLAAYQKIKPEDPLEKHKLVTVVAVAAFENIGPDLAAKFVETHWQAIDQLALVIDVSKDLKDLGGL